MRDNSLANCDRQQPAGATTATTATAATAKTEACGTALVALAWPLRPAQLDQAEPVAVRLAAVQACAGRCVADFGSAYTAQVLEATWLFASVQAVQAAASRHTHACACERAARAHAAPAWPRSRARSTPTQPLTGEKMRWDKVLRCVGAWRSRYTGVCTACTPTHEANLSAASSSATVRQISRLTHTHSGAGISVASCRASHGAAPGGAAMVGDRAHTGPWR
jgi:hypothetical protein